MNSESTRSTIPMGTTSQLDKSRDIVREIISRSGGFETLKDCRHGSTKSQTGLLRVTVFWLEIATVANWYESSVHMNLT